MQLISEHVGRIASGEISWLEAGEGPDLILLHGGGLDSAKLSWGHLIPELSQSFHVRAPNWPGYGGSGWDGGEYTTAGLVDCLEDLLEYWGVSDVCLAGVSLGGAVALGLALRRSDLVGRLVLAGSYGLQPHSPLHFLSYLSVWTPGIIPTIWSSMRWSRSSVRLTLRSLMWNTDAITDELVEQCYNEINHPMAGHAFMAWQRSEVLYFGLRTCYEAELGSVSQPAQLIHGSDDPLVSASTIKRAGKKMPHANVTVFPDTGHWPQRERPREFLNQLMTFTESLDALAGAA